MSSAFPELVEGEIEVQAANDCLLLRHVHPKAYDGDKIESWAFSPNSGDQGKMSVTQAAQVEVAEAFADYTATHDSAGMWGLTSAEISLQESRVIDDQGTVPALPSGHAYVDYRDVTPKSRKESKRAKALRNLAVARGCQFAPPSSG